MASFDWTNLKPGRRPFRHDKTITPHNAGYHDDYPSVIAVLGTSPRDEARQLAELLRLLKARGAIANYGQAALLLHSVQERFCGHYLTLLAQACVPCHRAPASSRLEHPASVGLAKGSSAEARFPTERVCITTIHQAKGLEWPVVVVGSLDGSGDGDDVGRELDHYSPALPSSRLTGLHTTTRCGSITWPFRGRGTCWSSPRAIRRHSASLPCGTACPAGHTWTPSRGTGCSASGLRLNLPVTLRFHRPTWSSPGSSDWWCVEAGTGRRASNLAGCRHGRSEAARRSDSPTASSKRAVPPSGS